MNHELLIHEIEFLEEKVFQLQKSREDWEKEKINEVALLKADVRRLDKFLKNMGEDYMKLAHPHLTVDDYDLDKPFTYEPLEGGIEKRKGIEGIFDYEKPSNNDNQPLGKIKRGWNKDGKIVDFDSNNQHERIDYPKLGISSITKEEITSSLKPDYWLALMNSIRRVGCLDVDLFDRVKDELDGFDLKISIRSNDQFVAFITPNGNSWRFSFKNIKNMKDLKNIYEDFKEIYG